MTTHYLKIEQRWFDRLGNNEKTAEVRLDDRDYQTGDRIWFSIPDDKYGRGHVRVITHVLRAGPGLAEGYVILSLGDPRVPEMQKRLDAAYIRETGLGNSNRGLRGRITMLNNRLSGGQ